MNKLVFCALFALAAATAHAQQSGQTTSYEGVSNPPSDETIVATPDVEAKPPAAHPYTAQQQAQPAAQTAPAPANTTYSHGDGTDADIVHVPGALPIPTQGPKLAQRNTSYADDPDGDIVRPGPLAPGELVEGTMIRVKLLSDLSSALSQPGDSFRARVASDVLSGGQVVIPAGAEIKGRVMSTSTGHFGGKGSMVLRPDSVTLADGSSFQLHAMVSGTPGTHNRVEGEGTIIADPSMRRASFEYGGAVGTGVITGAYLGGPVGALAGGLVGAGLVTTHLLVSHPQVHLDDGSYMMLTLTQSMHLVAATSTGN
jgi:hypothetical protein